MPKVRNEVNTRSYPDMSGLRRFLDAAQDDQFAAFWVLAVHTGGRIGELLALKWRHVNFQRAEINILGTWSEDTKTVGPPKSASGRRVIPLGPEPMAALHAHRAALQAIPHPEQFVFPSSSAGRPVHATTIRAHLKALLPKAGLPSSTRVHDLRHGACSVLANTTGVPLTVARDRLGHSSVRMTERYVHADLDSQRRAATALSEVLSNSKKQS
jgi:integrase